jgi:hypothetical protein
MSGIQKIHIQLAYNTETFINGMKYIIDEITIRDLSMINDDMIIGLRFLQHSVQTTIIHDKGNTYIHIKIMFHISQRYESVVELNKSRTWTPGLMKPMINYKILG